MMIHGDPEFVLTLHSVIEFIGTFAFALSGIRLAASKHYDWLGGFVCGVAVAIGGGTIRDVMLGVRPFWMLSPIYLICTLFAQLVVIACHRYLKRLDNTWFLFDTLGLALFNIAGIQMQLCQGGVIDKRRYLVKSGSHTFEVDEFYGDNEGLVMAEVELASETEAYEKPDFIGMEVTGDKRFYNSHLLGNPFSKWRDTLPAEYR